MTSGGGKKRLFLLQAMGFTKHNEWMKRHRYWVYILTNRSRTLYVGVTNNLVRRVYEHRSKVNEGFTKRYNIHQLVYFEETNDIRVAIAREKQIKGWLRHKKIALIEEFNPEWQDLSKDILE
jgi:putative endonuclease